MTDDAVRLLPPHPTCGRSLQVLLPAHQQVPCGRVAAAVSTAVAVVGLLARGGSQGCGGREINYRGQENAAQSGIMG